VEARDQAMAQLALALRVVDAGGVNRAMKLAAQFPGRSFDRILLDGGIITPDAHRQLVAAFEEKLRAAKAALAARGGAAPATPAATPRPTPGAPPASKVSPAPARPPAPGQHTPQRTPAPGQRPPQATPQATARPPAPPPPTPASRRMVVPMESNDALPVLHVPDDDGFDPDGSDESGGSLKPLPDDEDAILAEPTMVLKDVPEPEEPTTVLADTESTTVLSEKELESDEDALLAEPTMIVRDDAASDEDEILAQPTMVLKDAPESDEDAILSEPTMVLQDAPESDEDAILAQPTMVLQDVPDDDAVYGQPTVVLKDGQKDESGAHLAIDTKLARDAASDPKRAPARSTPTPGVKSKKGEGPLNRDEFQRRLKLRQGFDGFTVGDYKVLGEIARGAFGVVLEVESGGTTKAMAHQRGYEGRMALKVMLENKADPRETQRFLDEVRVLIGFDHPHIVRMFDAGVENGLTYYSMELIRGVECRSYVLKHGPMPPLLAVRVCKEVAAALAYVHSKRAYHRDLKPQNIMLDQATQPYRTLLIDFGLVTEHLSNEDKGLILGTPSYMPPEQAQPRGGHGDINVTSDIYSLGATLYYMLTGQSPFPGKDPRAIIKQVVAEKPKDPTEHKPDIPRRVADICMKCLEKKQRDRYHAARLLEADLDQALKSGQMVLKAKSLFGKIIGKRKE